MKSVHFGSRSWSSILMQEVTGDITWQYFLDSISEISIVLVRWWFLKQMTEVYKIWDLLIYIHTPVAVYFQSFINNPIFTRFLKIIATSLATFELQVENSLRLKFFATLAKLCLLSLHLNLKVVENLATLSLDSKKYITIS